MQLNEISNERLQWMIAEEKRWLEQEEKDEQARTEQARTEQMTHSELIMKTMGSTAPNMNHDTGIHYGVIAFNDVMSEALDDIYSHGEDLTYQSAVADVKAAIHNALSTIDKDTTVDDLNESFTTWLKDYVRRGIEDLDTEDILTAIQNDTSDIETITVEIWEAIQDEYSDSYGMDMCDSQYRYESDGYIIETSGTDLFVIQSPYYALARQCSPCAPNAGYLKNDGSIKSYCLGADWFGEWSPLPYDVYSVATDELVARADNGESDEPTQTEAQ